MSKENVLALFAKAAENEQLRIKLQAVSSFDELVTLGKEHGLDFSSDQIRTALVDLAGKPDFFGDIVRAVLRIFSPVKDDYPEIGVQPFSGDPNSEK